MKKKLIAAACGLLVSGVVCADDMKFYVGGDLGYNKLGYYNDLKNYIGSFTGGKIKSKVPSLGLLGGINFHENFGAEVGYDFYRKAKASFTNYAGDYGMKLQNMHLDVLGYVPFNQCFDFVGSVGVGQARVKEINDTWSNGNSGEKYNKIGFRLGAGMQYNIDCNFAARAMVGYQQVGKKNSLPWLQNLTSVKLGLTYTI